MGEKKKLYLTVECQLLHRERMMELGNLHLAAIINGY